MKNISVPSRFRRSLFCNTRVKSYPDGSVQVLVCDRDIFDRDGWEPEEPKPGCRGKRPTSPEESKQRAVRRARAQVRDLALCTPFKYFVTLTLDGGKVDRYDMTAITRKLNSWLDNQVRRRGLAYVLVPERHKDGAVHFHGFFNDALDAVDSGTISMPGKKPRKPRNAAQRAQWLEEGGHVVYNLPGWSLGFTTAIELYGEYSAAVSYVCKYIGKQQDGGEVEKIGGRWYYSGGDLGHPETGYTWCSIRDVETAEGAYRFDIPAAGLSFVQITLKGGDKIGESVQVPVEDAEVRLGLVLRQRGADGLRRLPHVPI